MNLPRVVACASSLALAAAFLCALTDEPSFAQERAALAPAVRLEPTSHAPVPEDPEDLWLVPDPGNRQSRPSPVLLKFAEGVRAFNAGDFDRALPLVSAPALAGTTLSDYATYYQGLTLLRLSRFDDARQALSALKDRPLRGYLVEGAVLARGEAAELANDPKAAADLYKDLTGAKPLDPQVAWYRLGRSSLAGGDRDAAVSAWMRLRYEFPLTPEAALGDGELSKLGDIVSAPTAPNVYKLELGRA